MTLFCLFKHYVMTPFLPPGRTQRGEHPYINEGYVVFPR